MEVNKTAIVSVYDKTGVVEFCKRLVDAGWTILSTGGTEKALSEAGISVIPVSNVTKFPEILEGRVKTLHPSVRPFGSSIAPITDLFIYSRSLVLLIIVINFEMRLLRSTVEF